MSALTSRNVLRPAPKGFKGWAQAKALALAPLFFSLLRRFKPVMKMGNNYLTSRYDDVREVFGTDPAFGVIYKPHLDVIMGGQPFFLGMAKTDQYKHDTDAMRRVVRPDDLPRLAAQTEALAAAIVEKSGGKIDVVDTLVRRVTFTMLGDYLGVPDPPGGDLRVWGTRLFEFQFVDQGNDPVLRKDVDEIAPALRLHIQNEIARRRIDKGKDDVLLRCLALQEKGDAAYSDDFIRTSLMGFVVGGAPPVVPQAMEQLLRRPAVLAEAQAAARADDDDRLRCYVMEAMRFDPLAPGLPRVALKDWTLGAGTSHATTIPAGAQVLAAFASAMMDSRRVANPKMFDPDRPASDYMHFGFGVHECFGRHINHATLHMMLKPLLKQPNLRRARGSEGKLSKNGPFAERLVVAFG
jgi:cytochrome P450